MAAARWSSRPLRIALVAVLLLVLVGGGLAIARWVGGGESHSVQVQALWYGVDSAGNVQGGVTPVDIAAVSDDPTTPLSVDVSGLKAAGAGPMWTAATATAGTQAVLESGIDPRLGQLTYALHEAIDGPSAGALMTVGSLAAINGAQLDAKTTMTGTVLPDGSVGPVGGVPEKIRAAQAAGFTRVLVPFGQRQAADPSTNTMVDVVDLGVSLGVEVVPVRSIAQAYELMTSAEATSAEETKPPIDPAIAALLARRAKDLNASTASELTALYLRYAAADGGAEANAESLRVTQLMTAADDALEQGDAVLAFTSAAEAAQEVRLWAVSARLMDAATTTPLPDLVARARVNAQAFHDLMIETIRTTAELPLTMVEQVPALADAVSWGDFALESSNVVLARLENVESLADLEQIARFLEVARFEAATYMSTCTEIVPLVGLTRMTDDEATVGLLGAYADLLAYAADANLAYVRSIDPMASRSGYIDELTDQAFALVDNRATMFPDLQGPTAAVVLRLSIALELFVETTYQVNALTKAGLTGGDAPPNLVPLGEDTQLETQAQTADEIAAKQVSAITSAGLDPSYVRWFSEWGSDLSSRRLPGTTDEQALHGLELQWFSVLQSRLLMALAQQQGTTAS